MKVIQTNHRNGANLAHRLDADPKLWVDGNSFVSFEYEPRSYVTVGKIDNSGSRAVVRPHTPLGPIHTEQRIEGHQYVADLVGRN